MNIYYVYSYLRDDGSPYYFGKGKGRRAFKPHHLGISTPKDKSKIRFIAEAMNEPDAFQAEMLLIYLYGRKDIGTGCLRNKTDGGEGRNKVITEETKKKMRSSALRRKPDSLETRKAKSAGLKGVVPWNKGKKVDTSKWAKRKRSPLSESTKQKISEACKGRTAWNKQPKT